MIAHVKPFKSHIIVYLNQNMFSYINSRVWPNMIVQSFQNPGYDFIKPAQKHDDSNRTGLPLIEALSNEIHKSQHKCPIDALTAFGIHSREAEYLLYPQRNYINIYRKITWPRNVCKYICGLVKHARE